MSKFSDWKNNKKEWQKALILSCQLAQNSNDSGILHDLASHKNPRVRAYVAYNKNTTITDLLALKTDKEDKVRYQVFRNENTPLIDLQDMARHDKPSVLKGYFEMGCVVDDNILEILFKNKNSRIKILAEIRINEAKKFRNFLKKYGAK